MDITSFGFYYFISLWIVLDSRVEVVFSFFFVSSSVIVIYVLVYDVKETSYHVGSCKIEEFL